MKRVLKSAAVVAVFLLLGAQWVYAGESASKTYKMTVIVPEIVGVNVPAPSSQSSQLAKASTLNQTVLEERVRDNRAVVFQSIVTK